MRPVVFTALVIAASVAGAAIAQVVQAPAPFEGASFDMQPDGHDFARHYPDAAFNQNVWGTAVLCCVARADRHLECGSAFEWPEGYGFGDASETVAREFRMSEESYELYRQNRGNWIRRTMVWRIAGSEAAPEYERAMALIREIREQTCLPTASVGVVPTAP